MNKEVLLLYKSSNTISKNRNNNNNNNDNYVLFLEIANLM